ncbi:MAG TPA: EAL domain-containing protein, partial [Candidatus Xenobia bacterium]|jgi:EAL domain-containing protein (putative c-di-GMP-specific phosphodiesterase class I)
MDIRIAIDDFGTGYSSLGCLKRFPITAVKLDRSFLQGLRAGSVESVIIRSIITMVHELGLEAVGEGVETREELDFLVHEGCDHMQGYLYSRPVPAEAMTALLQRTDVPWPGTI